MGLFGKSKKEREKEYMNKLRIRRTHHSCQTMKKAFV